MYLVTKIWALHDEKLFVIPSPHKRMETSDRCIEALLTASLSAVGAKLPNEVSVAAYTAQNPGCKMHSQYLGKYHLSASSHSLLLTTNPRGPPRASDGRVPASPTSWPSAQQKRHPMCTIRRTRCNAHTFHSTIDRRQGDASVPCVSVGSLGLTFCRRFTRAQARRMPIPSRQPESHGSHAVSTLPLVLRSRLLPCTGSGTVDWWWTGGHCIRRRPAAVSVEVRAGRGMVEWGPGACRRCRSMLSAAIRAAVGAVLVRSDRVILFFFSPCSSRPGTSRLWRSSSRVAARSDRVNERTAVDPRHECSVLTTRPLSRPLNRVGKNVSCNEKLQVKNCGEKLASVWPPVATAVAPLPAPAAFRRRWAPQIVVSKAWWHVPCRQPLWLKE